MKSSGSGFRVQGPGRGEDDPKSLYEAELVATLRKPAGLRDEEFRIEDEGLGITN